jgi:hypothetical protein
MKYASVLVRLLLGGLFVYAGGLKIFKPIDFADSIAAYQILPFAVINPLVLGLPIFEIGAGLLVIAGWQLRPAALAIVSMLTGFSLGIGIALVRGLKIDCGCFGQSWLDSQPPVALARDLILLVAAVWVYLGNHKK